MALINCPHCGATNSDIRSNCFKCQHPLREEKNAAVVEEAKTSETKSHSSLSVREQQELRSEFYIRNERYRKIEYTANGIDQCIKAAQRLYFTPWLLFLGMRLIAIQNIDLVFSMPDWFSNILFGTLVGCLGIGFLSFIVFAIFREQYRKKKMYVLKVFCNWLQVEKRVSYTPTFDRLNKRNKRYYDRIDISTK